MSGGLVDAGSIPAASTRAEYTTRLDQKQARKFILLGLVFCATYRGILELCKFLPVTIE